MENRTTAKDFFLHLGAVIALYAVTISFVNLLFRIINNAFPEVARDYYYWGGGSEISMPVATLIIMFPIFILLSWFVYKTYDTDQAKKNLSVRKWLTYITLFVAGIILAGDLVAVLYKFLDGQDLTLAFLLKALVVLLVSGGVFGYYLQDIRDKMSVGMRKMWAIVVTITILAVIILGFGVLGSPKTQRLIRMDNQKIVNLRELQWQIINYWQTKGAIPEEWSSQIIDRQSGKPYEYRKAGEKSFELCADFNRESKMDNGSAIIRDVYNYATMTKNENWEHGAGRHCFFRTIDPVAYPVISPVK